MDFEWIWALFSLERFWGPVTRLCRTMLTIFWPHYCHTLIIFIILWTYLCVTAELLSPIVSDKFLHFTRPDRVGHCCALFTILVRHIRRSNLVARPWSFFLPSYHVIRVITGAGEREESERHFRSLGARVLCAQDRQISRCGRDLSRTHGLENNEIS